VIANINEYGWHCVNAIEDDGHPPWTFTIGLYETRNHPEPIIIGRSRATSHYMLDKIATAPDEDRRYDLTCPALDLLPGIACYFIEAHAQHYHDYVGFARPYYRGKHFPLYQIVWPSNDGHYHWDKAARNSFKEWQPVLGRAPKAD
jgi:hypothetical protein